MVRRLAAVVLAASSASCGHPPIERPFVPPLRAADSVLPRTPSEDAPFRLGPPVSIGDESFPRLGVELYTLENGLRVLLVERRRFPVVAGHLFIDLAALNATDAGGWRARAVGEVFLAPLTGMLRTSGCGPVGCNIASQGTADQLDAVLGRIADLVCVESATQEAYAQRLAVTTTAFVSGDAEPWNQMKRSSRALVFGLGQGYGEPLTTPPPPTLDELRGLRRLAFVPRASTLILAGDLQRDTALAAIKQKFGGWSDRAPVADNAAPYPPPEDRRRVIGVANRAVTQPLGAIVARGPAPRDEDGLPFALLTQLLGGTPTSAAFRHVREQMGAAYGVGADLDLLPEASMFALGGAFEHPKAIDAMNGLLLVLRRARDSEIAPETLDRAKRALIAEWRRSVSTDVGVAALLAQTVSRRMLVESAQDFPTRVLAVTPERVRAVAQRYLADAKLRVVFVGSSDDILKLGALGLGAATLTDGYGRSIPPPRQATHAKR
jgi:zinc protease